MSGLAAPFDPAVHRGADDAQIVLWREKTFSSPDHEWKTWRTAASGSARA